MTDGRGAGGLDAQAADVGSWLQAARGGDGDAFARLIDHCGRSIRAGIESGGVYRRFSEFEDAHNEALGQIWTSLSTFEGRDGASPCTWMWRVARNTATKFDRSVSEHGDLEIDLRSPGREPVLDDHGDSVVNAKLWRDVLARLSPKYREVLVLHRVLGYSHEEIAKHLYISPGTVASRLNRAKRLALAHVREIGLL